MLDVSKGRKFMLHVRRDITRESNEPQEETVQHTEGPIMTTITWIIPSSICIK